MGIGFINILNLIALISTYSRRKISLLGVFPSSFTENGECSICYEKKDTESDKCNLFISNQKGVKLKCNHAFCQDCAEDLVECPICKARI